MYHSSNRQPGEDDAAADSLSQDQPNGHALRVPAVEKQAEYVRLKDMGLSVRPPGCYLGIHPSAKVWRAGSCNSIHYSRSYGKSRTSWQALLRVMELMLDTYVNDNSGSHDVKLAKSQLSRIRKLRHQEPPHED